MTASDEFLTDPGAGRDTVRAVARTDPPGIELHDDIQGHSENLLTPQPVSLSECDTQPFCFPIDRAYRIQFDTGSVPVIRIKQMANVTVRNMDAERVAEAVNREALKVTHGCWNVGIDSLGIKTYFHVTGRIESFIDENQHRRLAFPGASGVRIGIRSGHERPAATVTIGTSPRSLMRAVSCFGSALKAQSPERSFPTLRGHPPLIAVESGERDLFAAPDDLEQTPDRAEVIIRVPERFEDIYPITSLAYYLDAAVVPGEPALILPNRSIPLVGGAAPGASLSESAARILQAVFTLDCIARTEGLYPVELGERSQIEANLERADVSVDWERLYDAPLGERVARYLSIPIECIEPAIPRWPMTAHIDPSYEQAAYLPFIAYALGTLRVVSEDTVTTESNTRAQRAAVSDFLRTDPDTELGSDPALDAGSNADLNRSEGIGTVTVPETESVIDLWCASGHPITGAEPTVASCTRQLAAKPSGTIDVAVVSNSPAMRAEVDVAELYGLEDLLSFDVSLYEDLSADSLRGVLSSEHDLVHFVGHVSNQGLQTADGWLDVRDLPEGSVRAHAFVLNACRSYDQARALVDAGAVGGLCTVSQIGNSPATHIGRTLARLLNTGFTLGGSLDIIRDQLVTGSQYSIVGDPQTTIAKRKGGTPYRLHIEPLSGERYRASFHCYVSRFTNLGTLFIPYLSDNDVHFLNSGNVADMVVSGDDLAEFLPLERFPVTVEGEDELYWSWELQQQDLSTITN